MLEQDAGGDELLDLLRHALGHTNCIGLHRGVAVVYITLGSVEGN